MKMDVVGVLIFSFVSSRGVSPFCDTRGTVNCILGLKARKSGCIFSSHFALFLSPFSMSSEPYREVGQPSFCMENML